MRFIRVNDIKMSAAQQTANIPSGGNAKKSTRRRMHGNPNRSRAFSQRRTIGRNQLCCVPAIPQSLQQQQRLVLPAPPLRLQIDEQYLHGTAS
jgi:hypothetical protein